MNNKQIHDITLRLSQALDQNYDVVSLESVLSVITALEGATITKEQLEATRLAKYINQLRRRTKSDNLARRAKSLLKKWREMVGIEQGNDSTPIGATGSAASNPMFSPSAPRNIPDTENIVSISQLTSQQIQNQRTQPENKTKQQHQLCHSQPTSPISFVNKTNPNEIINSTMSNPALTQRNQKRLEKVSNQQPRQPTSFANLITGLDSSNSLTLRKLRDKSSASSSTKPTETFIIDHSSNSNSDKICLPSNIASTYTSTKNVPPIVIDLQDTNSSMNSYVSKDVTKASLPFSLTKPSTKKSKREKKRKERDILNQNQSVHDCDDNTASDTSYHHQRPVNILTVEDKSHYACPTISNISEILSLSNSSMSSVFPFRDGISKNIYDSYHNEFPSTHKEPKSDLTFAGKFKQSTSSSSTMCELFNYKCENVVGYCSSSPNKNKFTPFAGIGVETNSSDSTSNSHILQFNIADDAVMQTANISKQKVEKLQLKHDSNDKSMSNMSNKGNSSTDKVFDVATPNIILQQQSIDLTANDLSSEQAIKQPKKRGRKKGSKGVDSLIAKEASLSSHMLISAFSAGVKKVKTTKEIYAEMQNRKFHNVGKPSSGADTKGSPVINWPSQQQQKTLTFRRRSSCSDVAESDSCTMTSEQSCDSAANPSKIGKREIMLDSNSNYSQFELVHKVNDVGHIRKALLEPITATQTTKTIQHQILKILNHLAPPLSVKEIEQSLTNIIPCTCTILEVIPKAENDVDTSKYQVDVTDVFLSATDKKITKVEANKKIEVENTIATITSYFSNKQKDNSQQPPTKLKKSIFDLDFEDEEDPLSLIIADIGKTSKGNNDLEKPILTPVDDGISAVKIKTEENTSKDDHMLVPSAVVPHPSLDSIFPTYEVKLDPDCEAKARFDIQTQKITKFHIDSLHNCLIPNVNGNWNHAGITGDNNIINNYDDLDISQIIDGYGVVPCYGSEINEHIVKDLSHVLFTKKFKHNDYFLKNEILNNIPFMGVARIIGVSMKSHKQEVGLRKQRKLLLRGQNIYDERKKDNNFIQSETHGKSLDLCSSPIQTNNNNFILNTISFDMKSIKHEPESTSLQNDNLTPLISNATNIICSNIEIPVTNNANENKVSEFFENSNEMIHENIQTTDIDILNSRRFCSSINNLARCQHSINWNLKQQLHENKFLIALDQSEKSRLNLKRTNEAFKNKNIQVAGKRLKIAVNVNEGTQNQIQIADNSCDTTTDENSFSEDDFDSAEHISEHEHDYRANHRRYKVSKGNERNNKSQLDEERDVYNSDYHPEKHIVLTIKNTHTKSNSAINFISTVSISPNICSSDVNSLENNVEQLKLIEENQEGHLKQTLYHHQPTKKKKEEHISSYKEIFCKNPIKTRRLKFLKKKFNKKKVSFLSYPSPSKIKLHKLLFFSDEICHFMQHGSQRGKEYIFNISSCSSSCTDEDDYYNDKNYYNDELNKYSRIVRSPPVSSLSPQYFESSLLKLQPECKDKINTNAIENATSLDNDDIDNDDELPVENNHMLLTFNNLACHTMIREKNVQNYHDHKPQLRSDEKGYHENMLEQPLQNCDDNLYESNFSLIKYIDNNYSLTNINSSSNNDYDQVYNNKNNISSHRGKYNIYNKENNNNKNVNHNDLQISSYNEENTGKQQVADENVSDYDSNSVCLQQFKEWHEVLQLRSYNNELLTVLPYVVLE